MSGDTIDEVLDDEYHIHETEELRDRVRELTAALSQCQDIVKWAREYVECNDYNQGDTPNFAASDHAYDQLRDAVAALKGTQS